MPKQMFPEVAARLFHRVFICRGCGSKMRADLLKVKAGKIKCRNCKSKKIRQKHKDLKA